MTVKNRQKRLIQYMKRWRIDLVDLAALAGVARTATYRWLGPEASTPDSMAIPEPVLRFCEANQTIIDIWNELEGPRPSLERIRGIAESYLKATQARVDAVNTKRYKDQWLRERHYKHPN